MSLNSLFTKCVTITLGLERWRDEAGVDAWNLFFNGQEVNEEKKNEDEEWNKKVGEGMRGWERLISDVLASQGDKKGEVRECMRACGKAWWQETKKQNEIRYFNVVLLVHTLLWSNSRHKINGVA